MFSFFHSSDQVAAAEVADAATRKDEPPSTKGLWLMNIIIGLLGGLCSP